MRALLIVATAVLAVACQPPVRRHVVVDPSLMPSQNETAWTVKHAPSAPAALEEAR